MTFLYFIGGGLLATAAGALLFVSSLDEAHARAVDAERAAAGLPPRPMEVDAGPVLAGLFAVAGGGLSLGAVTIAVAFMLGR